MHYRITFGHGSEYWRIVRQSGIATLFASCTVGRKSDWMLINDRGVVTDAERKELIGQAPRIESVECQQVAA